MNRIFFGILTASILSACGSAATTRSKPSSESETSRVELVSKQTRLAGVKVKAGNAGSISSVALIETDVACNQVLESFSSSVRIENGEFQIYASAVVSDARTPSGLVCLGFNTVVNEVTLGSGVIGAESVKLQNIENLEQGIEFDREDSVVTTLDATLLSTEPACPAISGVNCIRNGTILNIETFVPCGVAQGPMGYVVDQNPNGKTTVALVLLGIGTARPDLIRCAALSIPKIIKIDVLKEFKTMDRVELKVLR
jgi:hypothetical protein